MTGVRELILSVGTHRGDRPLSPLEVAERLARHINDVGMDQALQDISLDKSTALRFLRLRDLEQDVAELVDWGRKPGAISFSGAAELTRLSDQRQRNLASAAIEHSLTKEEIRQATQLIKRRSDSVDEAVAATLRMRPSTFSVYVSLGAVTDETAQNRLAAMTQQARDKALLALVASARLPVTSGRLTPHNFSLVSPKELPDSDLARVEALINIEFSVDTSS